MGFRSICLVVASLGVTTIGVASAETPEEMGRRLVAKAQAAQTGFAGEGDDLELTITSASGDTATRRMKGSRMEVSGDGERSVLTLTWPADVKGVRLLTWGHNKGGDDQWLYLPSAKRVKRINSRDKSGSFMGSEFTLEDMAASESDLEKYTYRFLHEETLDGHKTWVIERTPVDKKSIYSKSIVWIDQDYLAVRRKDLYDRKGKLLKTAMMLGLKKVDKWWRPSQIEMNNVQTHKKSVFDFKSRKFGKVNAGDFDSESLSE